MRVLWALLAAAAVVAQEPAPTSAPTAAQAPVPETAPAGGPPKTNQAASSPAPSSGEWLSGSVELGYRSITSVGGNFQSYRSVINLGEGPKLFGLDFTVEDPKRRFFDRLDARGSGWGGDPYTTALVDARKSGLYHFSIDYRSIAYFNALPSFANPQAPGGFDEQAFDIRRRMADFSLDLFPAKRIIPFLAFGRNSGSGHGVTTWLTDASNEYAVPTLLRDSTDNYRGGVRFEYHRFHATLEQGGTTFKDDDQASDNVVNAGDRTTPLLGHSLQLSNLQQAYRIRGDSIYSRGLVTANPVAWISLSGQFLFSQPNMDIRYTDLAGGNLALTNTALFYSSQSALGTGTAKQPHVTGNAGFEMRPFRRLGIVESWMTDRYHDAAFGLFSQLFVPAAPTPGSTPVAALSTLANEQMVNYNQQQLDVMFDVTSKLTVRGGHRYVWGDATVLGGRLSQIGNFIAGELRRNVGLAGFTFRPWQRLSVNGDYEGAASDSIYFRTSLNDYQKMRARARYQASATLSFAASFTLLNNQNPAGEIRYDFQSRDNSLSIDWTPNGGRRISVTGEYDRSTLRSSIGYRSLPFLTPAVSSYRENAHAASAFIDLALPGYTGMKPKLALGGSLWISSLSRPTQFFEPLTRLSLPLRNNVSWTAEWRYYGVGEAFYLYEGFRTHVFMTGLRLTR